MRPPYSPEWERHGQLEDRWQTVPLDPPARQARTVALTAALADLYGCDGERLLALAHDTLTALAEKAKPT